MAQFSSERIYLVGYMASGKTTIGQNISEQLGYQHIDTDEAIIKLMGSSINDIFEQHGESTFRSYELRLTKLVTQLNKVVISTGGGLPVHHQNMDELLNSGLTIYLKASIDTLVSRLIHAKALRPLHHNQTEEQLRLAISKKLSQREKIYTQAHITIDANATPDKIVRQIISRL